MCLLRRAKKILLFAQFSFCKWFWTLYLSILLGMLVNGSIVKICFPAKWTSVPICFESAEVCTKRTNEATETLCGGYQLLLEKIDAESRVGVFLFVSDPR